jgi:Flp pilus assembly pilin Flp
MKFKPKSVNNLRGQAIAEYLILVALLAIASIGITQLLSKNLRRSLAKVNNAIAGTSRIEGEGEGARAELYDAKDLGDFDENTRNNEEKK